MITGSFLCFLDIDSANHCNCRLVGEVQLRGLNTYSNQRSVWLSRIRQLLFIVILIHTGSYEPIKQQFDKAFAIFLGKVISLFHGAARLCWLNNLNELIEHLILFCKSHSHNRLANVIDRFNNRGLQIAGNALCLLDAFNVAGISKTSFNIQLSGCMTEDKSTYLCAKRSL